MLRRLEKRILVDLPTFEARRAMFMHHLPPVVCSKEGGLELLADLDYDMLGVVCVCGSHLALKGLSLKRLTEREDVKQTPAVSCPSCAFRGWRPLCSSLLEIYSQRNSIMGCIEHNSVFVDHRVLCSEQEVWW